MLPAVKIYRAEQALKNSSGGQSNLKIMLRWALTFFIVVIIAAIFGFTDIAWTLFLVFLVLLAVSAVVHVFNGGTPK